MKFGCLRRRRSYVGILTIWSIFVFAHSPVQQAVGQAASSSDEEKSSRSLASALVDLAAEAGADLMYDPALVADRQAVAFPRVGTVEERLAILLEDSGLTFYRLSSGTYVLVSSPQTPDVIPARLTGYVLDGETGEGISGAHVLIPGEAQATATDGRGLFRFDRLRPGSYRLLFSHVGYSVKSDSVSLEPGDHGSLAVRLAPVPIAISPLLIDGVQGVHVVHARDRSWMPRLMARNQSGVSPDVVRSLDQMMGVRVGDALAHVHVQGGEAGDHQFRLDGVPVFEPVHLRGLLGAFNPYAIDRITVHKAGFGVEHGSHLAGVIAAEHARAPSDGRNYDLQIDPISLNALAHHAFTPSPNVSARMMAAIRTSVWSLYPPSLYPPLKNLLREWNTPDGFLERASLLALEAVDPEIVRIIEAGMDSVSYSVAKDPDLGFGDLHLVADIDVGTKHRVFASFYRGWNKLNGNQLSIPLASPEPGSQRASRSVEDMRAEAAHRDDYRWVNATAQVRYMTLLSHRAATSVRVRSSVYVLSHEYNALGQAAVQVFPMPDGSFHAVRLIEDVVPTDNGNRIQEKALEGSVDLVPAQRHIVQIGAEAIHTSYRFNVEDVTYSNSIADSSQTWRFSGFIQDEYSLTPGVSLQAGSRFTTLPGRRSLYVEPRMEVRYVAPTGRAGPWSAWAASGIYRQFINQFSVSSVSPSVLLPAIRFWLPIDATVDPPKAYHVAAGMHAEPIALWTVRLETYYKIQPRQLFIDYVSLWNQRQVGASASEGQSAYLYGGRGYGYGSAVSLERESRATRFVARYEFENARRTRTLLGADDVPQVLGDDPVRPSGYEPTPWSEPHRLDLSAGWRISPRMTTTVRWRGAWGRTWAFRQSYYDYLGTDPWLDSPRFGEFNIRSPEDHSLPPFHQLDLSVSYAVQVGPAHCQFRADLLNALNRSNTADWTLQRVRDPDAELQYRVVARPLLPRTPSITLRVRW